MEEKKVVITCIMGKCTCEKIRECCKRGENIEWLGRKGKGESAGGFKGKRKRKDVNG